MDFADLADLTQRRVLYEMVWDAGFAREVYPRTSPADFGMRAGLAALLATHDRTHPAPARAAERVEAVLGRLQRAAVAAEDYRRQVAAWRAEGMPGGMAPPTPMRDEPRWFMVTAAARGLAEGWIWDVVAPLDALADIDVRDALAHVQANAPLRAAPTLWREGHSLITHGGSGPAPLEPAFSYERPDPGDPYLDEPGL
ncbi:hypothetical protein [Sanguibacter massiliensis]|uniref:hypothetical protein n=1 Tax=Sanguibacter massiliensis TaxID=1973217 RepID=UPI000C81C9D6|nr:hypothetical protein [Sanguibacter massiliensis]